MKTLATDKVLRNIITEIAIAIFFLIFLTITSLSLISHKYQTEKSKEYSLQIDKSLHYVIDYFVQDYSGRAMVIVQTTNISELVKNRDREALLKLLGQRFKGMKIANNSLEVMHVHLADGTSLLRVHSPDQYGDNIAQRRAMLREVHKTHRVVSGYESGLHGNDYRLINPIFDDKGVYLGALELGLNLDFILNSISSINGYSGLIFIKENQLSLKVKPSNILIDGYKLQSALNDELRDVLKVFQSFNQLEENLEFSVNNKQYRSHVITMRNFKDDESVKIVFFQDLKKTASLFTPLQYFIYILILVILVGILGLIRYRINKYQEVLRKIDQEEISKLQESKLLVSQSENYLQSIFDAIPTILIVSDGEKIKRVNSAMLAFFGYDTLESFSEHHQCVCELFIEQDGFLSTNKDGESWLEYIKSRPQDIHKVCIKVAEEKHYFLLESNSFKYNAQVFDLISFTEITDLEMLSQRLEIAVNGTNDGLWDWNIAENKIFFSLRWKEMLGYQDTEIKNSFETWQTRVHPDDLDEVLKQIDAVHADPSLTYENIHRLRHKNGSWVWVLDRGETIFDELGNAVRMVGFHTDITKQKELELKLLNSQKQFEYFMEFIPASIAIKEEDGTILYANNSMQAISEKDIVGLKAEDLFPDYICEKINKLDQDALNSGRSEALLEFVNTKGKLEVFRNLSFRIDEKNCKKIGVISIDITDEYQAQYEVAKLKLALERGPISIMMTDADANIEYVNKHYEKMSGYTLKELVGKNPRIVKSGDTTQEQYEKMWKQISSGNVWSADLKNIAKDGHEFWENSTIIPTFSKDGLVNGYIAFKFDISDEIAIRKQLKDQEEMMIAQSRHAAMGEMISMIAHQWRQPISVIAMDANNVLVDIELELLDEKVLKANIENILAQTSHLSKTIDDFRNFFKPNKLKDKVNIAKVFEETLHVINKSLEVNNIEVINNFETTSELEIYSRELLQVLLNILKNAKEALVENTKERRKIINTIKENNDDVIITICDNGGGIKDEVINKIFDPYFSTKEAKNGTGLGLYMSKTIIEKHLKGSIKVQKNNGGVCFIITLPKKSVDE